MIYILLTYLFSPVVYSVFFLKKRRFASQLLVGKAHPTPFLKKQAEERILVIQTAKIGDLICSTPVFRAIKKRYPHAHLSVMVNPVTKELLEHNPNVHEIIAIEGNFHKGFLGKVKLARLVYKGRYDIAISLNPNLSFILTMFWGLIPVRISIMPDYSGITYKMASQFCTYIEKHSKGRLVAETYMKMLKAIGIESNDISKEVFKSPDADNKVAKLDSAFIIGIAVTSGNRLKEWGAEKMAALADRLITDLNSSIVLIGSKKDRDISDKILQIMAHRNMVIDAVGEFNLSELPAIIERLSIFIGVDTGITYMADAMSIPTIDIAGPSDMEDARPTGKKVLIIQNKLSCVPCSHAFKAPYSCIYGHRKCITDITVEEVFTCASKLLG